MTNPYEWPTNAYANPSLSLTDHLGALMAIDEILVRHFPGTTSGERFAAVAEIYERVGGAR